MSFERLATWFLSETGKKFSYYFSGTISSCVMLGHVLPNTIFIDQYKNFVHLYHKGFTVPVTNTIQERFKKALELAGVGEEYRIFYKPFNAVGFDVLSAGSSYSKFGVIVGIPANFSYKDVDSIEKYRIKLTNEGIAWDSEAGQKLLQSFIISESAQLYAMAREIKFRDTPKLFIDTIVGTTGVIATYCLSNAINTKFNLYGKPLPIRLVMYGLVTAFTLGNYFMVKDGTQIYYERTIDEELKNKSPIFVEGGKEYYSKLLLRNMALRHLMGKGGEAYFSPLGNENSFIRTKHLPLLARKQFFEETETL